MARDRGEPGDRRLAAAFAVLLVVVVGVRLVVVWFAGTSGLVRWLVSLGLVTVFVGIPAAYGLWGLLRGDDGDESAD